MSRLWPDRMAILVSARQMHGVRRAGIGGRTEHRYQCDCGDRAFPEDSLGRMLESLKPDRQARLHVVLGNPWVRHALTPPVRSWLSPQESEALARHVFIESHGEAARQWAIRQQLQGHDAPLFASAVEQPVLDSIQRLADRFGITHLRIVPLLGVAWNHARRSARGLPWFALAETSLLTLIHQQRGAWRSLALHSPGDGMAAGFRLLLERESTRLEERGLGGAGINLNDAPPPVENWNWLGRQGQDAGHFWAAEAAK